MKTNSLHNQSPNSPPPFTIEQSSIPELFFNNATHRGPNQFARFPENPDGHWAIISWKEVATQVLNLARALENLGVKKGDKVAIISATRFEWAVTDLAILTLGAVSVPAYHSASPAEIGFVLWDSGATVLFAENEEQIKKLHQLETTPTEIPPVESFPGGQVQLSFKKIITFEESVSVFGERQVTFNRFLETVPTPAPPDWLRSKLSQITRTDLATIVYTSGTTGVYKGVLQSHGNHISMLDGVLLSSLLGNGEGLFLFLPLAHSFARLVLYCAIAAPGSLVFPSIVDRRSSKFDARQLLKDMRAGHPRYIPTVPRIFEKIMASLQSTPKSKKDQLIAWSIKNYIQLKTNNTNASILTMLKFALASAIIAKLKRTLFGNNFQYAISGGAPMGMATLQFFDSIDIAILEGYGLTETTPAMTANTLEFRKLGTVGRPFWGVEIKIAEDGEILTRGGNIALGYHNRPKATAETFQADGWLLTGDIGVLDEDGFLKITDRKKELIVNANGKNIAPSLIEHRLKSSPYISQALVYGDRRPYLVALITLERENISAWLRSNFPDIFLKYQQAASNSRAAYHLDPEVGALIALEVKTRLADLSNFEMVQKFSLLEEDFSVEAGLLTPSLKLKRKAIIERYRREIEGLYARD